MPIEVFNTKLLFVAVGTEDIKVSVKRWESFYSVDIETTTTNDEIDKLEIKIAFPDLTVMQQFADEIDEFIKRSRNSTMIPSNIKNFTLKK